MSEFLYGYNSVIIVGVLLALILAANSVGYGVGRRHSARTHEGARTQTNAIQAAMLGLLALLLSFTFTMALQRFDNRSEAVIDEANAIGTAYLRTALLPETEGRDAAALIEAYVRLRLEAGDVDLTQATVRRSARAAETRLQEQMWHVALRASTIDARPTTVGLFVQSLNEVIDSHGRRDASLKKHVPEVVLLLLFAVFVIVGTVLGYAGGLAGARSLVSTVAMSLLIVLVIFIIIDLDRPRRGLIRVNQDSMIDLSASFPDPPTSLAVSPGRP